MVIPFNKIKKINAPGTMIQEQKIQLIIDVNTKRKLFGKLISNGEIYLLLCAEVFIPDKKNICLPENNEINNINNMKKINNNKQIKVRISNKKNSNIDGTPRTIKKRKMIMEIKSNREILKKDNSNDNINKYVNPNNNYKNDVNSSTNNDSNDEKNSTGMFRNKIKLDNNQIKIIDFRNKNDNLYNKNNEVNLTKEIKKSILKKCIQ